MRDGMNKMLGGITKALVIEPEEGGRRRTRKTSGEPIFDRHKVMCTECNIYALTNALTTDCFNQT